MVKIVSMINLKGGVGKTTLTVALAEFLAHEHNKKILVIDLDPQTNATVALMDEKMWKEKDVQGETIFQLFNDKINKTSIFQVDKAIVHNVSNITGGINNLDLLPSSISLTQIQDDLATIEAGKFHIISPVTILKNALGNKLDEYDVVLIDCPPNLGIITLNGLIISDYFLIPCIPDILSTYGIPQILNLIESFSKESNHSISPLGIVFSMYRQQHDLHASTVKRFKKDYESGISPRVFNTKIPLASKISGAMDFKSTANTIKQKYGYDELYENFEKLANEFLRCCDIEQK